MRTIQVINVQWYNATAWYAVYLAHALNQAGHPSIVVGIKDSLPLQKAKKLGLDTYELPLNSLKLKDIWACNRGISELCRAFNPDIVNCHRGELFFLWALNKHKFHYKLIRTRGDQRLPDTNMINKFLHRKCADAVISSNSKMTKYFASNLGIPARKLHTVLGGVNTKEFYPSKEDRESMRTQYKLTDKDVLVGLIGRLDPVKGHKEVLGVFKNLFKKPLGSPLNSETSASDFKKEASAVNLHLAIVGGDCDYTIEDLCQMGKTLGIPQENLHCIGYVDDMRKTMCMLDLGIIASLSSETVARVAFEMIACHVPIISSSVGVMPDILDEKYIYEPYDFHRMEKLLRMSQDETFRHELQTECVGRFEAKEIDSVYGWSVEKFVEKTLKIYRDC